MEYKNATFECKGVQEDGIFEGYASVFNVTDQGNDIVAPGAFAESLGKVFQSGKKPKMLWQHDPSEVIGVWDEMHEDERGLFVKGRLLKDVAKGRDALALLRAKAIDGMSIGYRTVESVLEGASDSIRRLTKLDLMEVSLVTFPMNTSALVTDVKNLATIRDVETVLRDAGVPNHFAKLVAVHGFEEAKKITDGQRDAAAADENDKALEGLLSSINRLKEQLNA